MTNNPKLFDVLAVEIATGNKRVMIRDVGEKAAEAFIRHAVIRRGVEKEIYTAVPADSKGGSTP